MAVGTAAGAVSEGSPVAYSERKTKGRLWAAVTVEPPRVRLQVGVGPRILSEQEFLRDRMSREQLIRMGSGLLDCYDLDLFGG